MVERALAVWEGNWTSLRVEPLPLAEAGILKLNIAKAEALLGWRPILDLALRSGSRWSGAADTTRIPAARALLDEQIDAYRRLCATRPIGAAN